nr:proteoglycan 4-like [Oncorhynchus nerka]
MAAQVEVQTGEVERIGVGGQLHLSPLSDSSNKSLTEGPSNTQASLTITPEPSKPVPTPKPRLTPKPFAVEKNPTIRPILAPKPNTNPRPVPTRPTSYKPDSPSTPKLQQPNVTSKHRPGPTNPSCPAPNSYKPSHKLSMGQTTKPVAQPFKPAPLLTPGDPNKPTPSQPVRRQKPAAAGLLHSRGPKKPPSAEWSGSTKPEKERNKTASSIRAGAASMTRAKSMGFLSQIGQDEEERKGDEGPTVTVQLRSQSRASRPRPVSAIFLPSSTQAESPTPAARWAVRRPLSADLTSKFESIGLSLHHGRPAKTDSKENTPGEPLRRTEKKKGAEGTNVTPPAPDSQPSALVGGREKKTDEEEEEDDEGKGGGSIKRRISLFLDSSSSSSPVVPLRVAAQRPGSNSPVQPIQEADVTLDGVKQRTRKLTEYTVTPPAQTPAVKPQFKSHLLPPDLTKRLGSERSTDLGSPSPNEATDRHESDTDPQRRVEDSVYTFSDQKKVDDDIRGIQEQPTQTTSDPSAVLTEAGRWMESCPSSGAQTVRAALFENVVERHSVLVMEEDRAQSATKGCPKRSVSLKLGDGEKDGTLVTATYRKPVSPSSPLLVEHLFDTVQAVGERRAVSECVPLAQLEDKAMTLRSRRSEGNRSARAEPVEERHAQVQGVLSMAQRRAPASQQEQGPHYLRVGVLQKWNTTEMDREAEVEKGRQREKERERKEEEKERQREAERRMQMDGRSYKYEGTPL